MTLIVTPLDLEIVVTGDFWSKTEFLKIKKEEKKWIGFSLANFFKEQNILL